MSAALIGTSTERNAANSTARFQPTTPSATMQRIARERVVHVDEHRGRTGHLEPAARVRQRAHASEQLRGGVGAERLLALRVDQREVVVDGAVELGEHVGIGRGDEPVAADLARVERVERGVDRRDAGHRRELRRDRPASLRSVSGASTGPSVSSTIWSADEPLGSNCAGSASRSSTLRTSEPRGKVVASGIAARMRSAGSAASTSTSVQPPAVSHGWRIANSPIAAQARLGPASSGARPIGEAVHVGPEPGEQRGQQHERAEQRVRHREDPAERHAAHERQRHHEQHAPCSPSR